ncbi:hypothetical protein [Acidithiobacillus ferriphilus]|uniref:hypothetical protein n=1 Tax=Acidithiobacillus ferriphilus TaxID=1689834 RepID=UPI0023304CB3|nr:hypothetical protein [Acidithiobacillus ferriphilus]WCE93552.1 hypothetical protein PJU76_11395 [Acidithiobacillus ferriphilus]
MDNATMIDAILRIVTATNKGELKKLCKRTIITENAFAEFIRVCQAPVLPWTHAISYRDILPKNWELTPEDSSAMPDLSIGPPDKDKTRAMKKWLQMLHDRRYLVGHLFYSRDHRNWQFFYFDNRDLNPYDNHFKHGAHVHLINYLWPEHTPESILKKFMEGNPKMKGAMHIRFYRQHSGPSNT